RGVKGDRVEGTIVAVDLALGKVTIRTQAGEFVPAMTNSSTKIERNGFHARLASFQIGDRGQARFNPGTLLAYKIEATGL
ncbi:MAG: repeat protein, partial [Bacteroidetes bacterium]|nr:repeat protein [Bacteroidota bacterium]